MFRGALLNPTGVCRSGRRAPGCDRVTQTTLTANFVLQRKHDIALLRMSERATFSSKVGPACLALAQDVQAGDKVVVAGWGRLNGGEHPYTLATPPSLTLSLWYHVHSPSFPAISPQSIRRYSYNFTSHLLAAKSTPCSCNAWEFGNFLYKMWLSTYVPEQRMKRNVISGQ